MPVALVHSQNRLQFKAEKLLVLGAVFNEFLRIWEHVPSVLGACSTEDRDDRNGEMHQWITDSATHVTNLVAIVRLTFL